jgi:hypothetical protein
MGRTSHPGSLGVMCEILVAVGLLTACPGPEPTLSSIQAEIFTPSCALGSCHGGATPERGLNLTAGRARESLVNQPSPTHSELLRVKPGAPEESLLVLVLEGRAPPETDPMPVGGRLDADSIAAIREWISLGANDD